MANGFLQRFQGKVKVGQLWLASSSTSSGEGGLYDAATGLRMGLGGGARLAMPVTAVANTDYPALKIPTGAAIASMIVYTTVAYTGGSALLTIGSAAGGAQYVASVSIANIGVVNLTLVNAAAAAFLSAPAAGFFVRVNQSSAPTAVGAATLVIDYDLL